MAPRGNSFGYFTNWHEITVYYTTEPPKLDYKALVPN